MLMAQELKHMQAAPCALAAAANADDTEAYSCARLTDQTCTMQSISMFLSPELRYRSAHEPTVILETGESVTKLFSE